MHPARPEPPPWIGRLPVERRGFPIPAEAAWEGDEPRIEKADQIRTTLLVLENGCAVCGLPLGPGPVYRAFSQADAAQIRMVERDLATDLNSGAHESCMYYSVYACPYLSHARARLGLDTSYPIRTSRGTRPAVMGFRSQALLAPQGLPPMVAFVELVDDHPYREPSDVYTAYEAALAKDAWLEGVEAGHYWQGGRDPQGLETQARRAFAESARKTGQAIAWRGINAILVWPEKQP